MKNISVVKHSPRQILLFSVLFTQFLSSLGLLLHTGYAQTETTVFISQKGTPIGIPNFVQLEKGCNWSGIGGQVFNQFGEPMTGLVIKIAGKLEGQNILYYAVTGGSPHFGPGGYLVELANHPIASTNAITIQVLDVAGAEKSSPIPLTTYPECIRNLLLVNITEIQIRNPVFFPLIRK